ncbi:MAG: transposase, partial [Candidatus Omnitrophica bacterium]|nr:transposase [Candidatus Omnitrophota bacterium]
FQTLEVPAWAAARQLLRPLVRRRWVRWSLLVIDGSLLAAHGRPPRTGRRPRPPTDPDASWGYSPSDGWVWGYRLHGLVSAGPATAPVAWRTTTATGHETRQVQPLLRQTPRWRGKRRGWLVGDGTYDSQRLVALAARKRRRLVAAMYIRRWGKRAMSSVRRQRWDFVHSPPGKRLLRRRTVIERDWSQLKHVFLLDPLPVTRLARVQVYVSLVLVAYLAAVTYNGSMHRSLRAIKSLIA